MMQKKIIVTGGSRGIGFSIAKELLKQGYAVCITGRHEEELLKSVAVLSPNGEISHAVFDISNPHSVEAFAKSIVGPLYGLINNAGICKTQSLGEESETVDPWEEVLATNLTGPYLLARALVQKIEDGGRIVNISSQLGKEGRAGYSAYCASKFALIGLTKTWAKELGVRNITVNAVCPGWVRTDMGIRDLERLAAEKGKTFDEYYKEICAPLELKRFTEPEEVAALVAFLVSKEASGVTGRDMLLNTIWNQE